MPHEGRDVRAFVVGDRVVAAAWRCAEGWRTNVAQGARVERATLPPEWHDLSVRAARAVTAEYAGVDLLPLPDGRVFVLEVNSIPGWQGLQSVTEVDVAAAIAERLEAMARRPDAITCEAFWCKTNQRDNSRPVSLPEQAWLFKPRIWRLEL